MNKERIRKLYDETDHLVNHLVNVFDSKLAVEIGGEHWNEIWYDIKQLQLHADRILDYVANKIMPDMEAHPDRDRKPGGVFINGERQ